MNAGHRKYPAAPRLATTDRLHGRAVSDPYRWLEDRYDQRTKDWLARQDELYADYLSGLAGHDRLATRLAQLHDVGAVGLPVWRGKRWFATRRGIGQELDVLYTGQSSVDQVLVDPHALDRSCRTTLDDWEPDHEGRLLAYRVSRDGSEEPLLWVVDVDSGEIVDGPIDRARHGSVAWLAGGSGFYYTRRLHPNEVRAGEEQYHRRVYLHRLGRPADTDVMIFGEGRDKTSLYRVTVSPEGRWLIIWCSKGTESRNDVWIADLYASNEEAPDLRVVQEGVDARTNARVGRDGRLYLLTDLGAPRRRLAVADPARPGYQTWRDLLPEDDTSTLTGYALLNCSELDTPVLVAARSRHAVSEITTHDALTGEPLGVLELPGLGKVSAFAEHPDGGCSVWFGYTDFRTPETIMCYDARSRTVEAWRQPPGRSDVPRVDTRQVEYRSADGTSVRMFVIAQVGALDQWDGRAPLPRPTILYGYGGFNVSPMPTYSPPVLAWVEAGGNYVIAGLRGGGEQGEEWHRAGMRDLKQNTFTDLYAAAERLVAAGWTSPRTLCVSGVSNGGLLVGAAITQQPKMFAAALCQAPLLDMIRYEGFGLGRLWTDEYGSAADPQQFAWLLAYSPYHHVRDGTPYPAVLFSAFEGDTRVDPMHARKMCAAMQHATTSPDRPILLRRESQVGHGVRAVGRAVALDSDMLAFAAVHTGLQL